MAADPEEPRFNTLAERIAALNKQKNFDSVANGVANSPHQPAKRPPPPAPPVRPATSHRAQTDPASVHGSSHPAPATPARPARANAPPPLPRRDTSTSTASSRTSLTVSKTAPPPLPERTLPLPAQTPPALPRRASTQSTTHLSARPSSASSSISQHSRVSIPSLSSGASSSASYLPAGNAPRNMAPATFDPASLPALPPSKRDLEARAKEAAAQDAIWREERGNEIRARQAARLKDAPVATKTCSSPAPVPVSHPPSLPPRLPSRPAKSPNTMTQPSAPAPAASTAHADDEAKPAQQKLLHGTIRGFGSGQQVKPTAALPTRGAQQFPSLPTSSALEDTPPPVPLSSRPSVADMEAISSRSAAQQPQPNGASRDTKPGRCWVCRDWRAPDAVAGQFPRQSLPRNDAVGHLARGLCDPFPSYDDKARAIFTWCHHNIAYDTVSFFNNDVRHRSVQDTIFSGLAVCQGYAEVYMAVAKRAGLECLVVAGHGKGFGHRALKRGERPPPARPDGHAWNAVRVDGGVWKLVDACWGAGHLCAETKAYKQEFSPREFTLSNELFGRRHFPQDPRHQFRADGRTLSWDEYYTGGVDGEPFQWFGTGTREGLSEDSVEPKNRDISVRGGHTVRFQFSKNCEHWTSEKAGLGRAALFLLSIHGRGGQKDDFFPMETNGYWHWGDVDAEDLGAPGQSVDILVLDTMDGGDGRGVTAQEFLTKRGRVGMSWSCIARWNLVS
ncbi:hypothetical protein E4U42_002846 [Claviceps africana]|uniref:Transglutaminase-like domain-containing protein n=1 Tax=Claviceps africana TaxID=83212 RepID=A0A8K0J7F5_9HYPO|nr:hypothetical protein E4U42_002846 [Claviceps africana]